jgi:hypothetical protein
LVLACWLWFYGDDRHATEDLEEVYAPNVGHDSDQLEDLCLEAGERIRVCKWFNDANTVGAGINMITASFGKFKVEPGTLVSIT